MTFNKELSKNLSRSKTIFNAYENSIKSPIKPIHQFLDTKNGVFFDKTTKSTKDLLNLPGDLVVFSLRTLALPICLIFVTIKKKQESKQNVEKSTVKAPIEILKNYTNALKETVKELVNAALLPVHLAVYIELLATRIVLSLAERALDTIGFAFTGANFLALMTYSCVAQLVKTGMDFIMTGSEFNSRQVSDEDEKETDLDYAAFTPSKP